MSGWSVFTGPRDYDWCEEGRSRPPATKAKRVVILAPTDFPILKALADVGADMMQKIGLNVDYQAMDWGTVVQRRAKMDPVDQGRLERVPHLLVAASTNPTRVGHVFLRGNGKQGMMGWPSSPKLEALRTQWIAAPDLAAQQKIAVEMQRQALIDVPYVPLGQTFSPTCYRQGHQRRAERVCHLLERAEDVNAGRLFHGRTPPSAHVGHGSAGVQKPLAMTNRRRRLVRRILSAVGAPFLATVLRRWLADRRRSRLSYPKLEAFGRSIPRSIPRGTADVGRRS